MVLATSGSFGLIPTKKHYALVVPVRVRMANKNISSKSIKIECKLPRIQAPAKFKCKNNINRHSSAVFNIYSLKIYKTQDAEKVIFVNNSTANTQIPNKPLN